MQPRFSKIFAIIYFVILSCGIAPPSPDWQSSWLVSARELLIRAAIAIVFVAVTRRVVDSGSVSADRITPGPPPPPVLNEPVSPTTKIPARLSTRQRVILALSAAVFFVCLASDWHRFYPILPSPRGLISILWAIGAAFCIALFVWSFLTGLTRKPAPERAPNRSSARGQLILIAVCVIIASGYLITHTAWWRHQLWVNQTVDAAFGNAISLFCWGCLIFFWMPKPGQMSANQPELLHVVPTRPPQNDHA